MTARINQARSALTKMFNSERYSRFTLQSEEEGGPHVEVKLSSDGIENDHVPDSMDESHGSPSYRAPPRDKYRNVCYLALGTLLIFVIGYLIGYVSHRSPQRPLVSCDPKLGVETEETEGGEEEVVEKSLDWSDINNLLGQKLNPEAFDKRLSEFARDDHEAGSDGDRVLGNRVFEGFKSLQMNPWTDIHYVQLQTQNSTQPNRVLIGSEEVGQPTGYLAYSARGTVKGQVVYANYGRREDLQELQNQNVELKNKVVLLRAGRLNFAEQVASVAELGASAVLIYPDPQDYDYQDTTELYGHVHLGSGDPYTPGFPSFNHTQFPPTRSSGLPSIPAQTITAQTAAQILKRMGGAEAPSFFTGRLPSVTYRLGGASDGESATVEVNNVLVTKELHNVFGIIKGFTDPDQYVVLGAQRDSWGPGYAKATVGTTLLMELARAVFEMVEHGGFRPRRSLLFASWSGGDYGSVGATEWLEGYLSSLNKKALTYVSLDGAVTGTGAFRASASPLLHTLLESTMKKVKNPIGSKKKSLYEDVAGDSLQTNVLRPMQLGDCAYPFLAFSGIPSLSFSFFSEGAKDYPYSNTFLDNKENLDRATNHRLSTMAVGAGQLAGQLALQLVHDHILRLDVAGYGTTLGKSVHSLRRQLFNATQSLSGNWLAFASGSYSRAVRRLQADVLNTDLNDAEACRFLNERIMTVEQSLLSPYVSPVQVPFRHVVFGLGPHTLGSLGALSDPDELHTQLALATWTLQGCANGLVGDVWELDNEI
ncbi:transferrin receptor 1b [Osmerus eperlanus]|uniref:transferrin receptor 1b n=1 Tax=Osmerus eperlanus TaxID=29151 RepID=UPI002E1664B4